MINDTGHEGADAHRSSIDLQGKSVTECDFCDILLLMRYTRSCDHAGSVADNCACDKQDAYIGIIMHQAHQLQASRVPRRDGCAPA